MSRYIGLDVHAQTTAVAVISESGRRLEHQILRTSAAELIQFLRRLPKPRKLLLEEGAQSEWLSQVLEPFVEEFVVTVPRPAKDRAKNDVEDAFARAEDLRRNAIDKRIFKADEEMIGLRSSLKLYESLNRDTVRAKNRLRGLLIGRGISERVPYDPSLEELQALMERLPRGVRFGAEARLEQISYLVDLRSRAEQELLREATSRPAFRYLVSVPGIGPIRAATVMAIVIDPHRFRRSEQFHSYCGLGVLTVASGEWVRNNAGEVRRVRQPMVRGLKQGNALLKNTFCGAAMSVTKMKHPLEEHYRSLVARGLKENLARITLARKLAAITLAVWKRKEIYSADQHHVLK